MRGLKIATVAFMGLTLSGSALAQFPYATSFESPSFTAATALAGQAGWDTGGNRWTVSNDRARTGSQAVKWTTEGGGSGTEAFFDISGSAVTQIIASTYIYIDGAGGTNYRYGMRAYFDDSFSASRPWADVVVRKDGEVLATQGVATNSTVASVGNIGSVADSWVKMTLTVDLVNNTTSAKVGSLDVMMPGVLSSNTITDIDLFATPFNPEPNSFGRAYFDDYSIEAVPEPVTLIALAAGAAVVARRRRK